MYREIDFLKFQKKFSNEKKCIQYLIQHRWPNGFKCPRCQNSKGYWYKKRKLFMCSRCGYQASVTAGTILHKTHTPLHKWFWAIFLVSQFKNGISAKTLQKLLAVSYNTAWMMLHKIRQAMFDRDERYKLHHMIELDDAYFGQKDVSGPRGRGSQGKTKVVVAVEVKKDRAKYARFQVVEKLDSENIAFVANRYIHKGSHIKTDGLPVYRVLGAQGFSHDRILIGKPKRASEIFPWVHILISNAKNFIRATYHGVSVKHLFRYLAEYTYRFNRRFNEKLLFDRLLVACVTALPISFLEITK